VSRGTHRLVPHPHPRGSYSSKPPVDSRRTHIPPGAGAGAGWATTLATMAAIATRTMEQRMILLKIVHDSITPTQQKRLAGLTGTSNEKETRCRFCFAHLEFILGQQGAPLTVISLAP
jgi:hypothetical protein